MRKASGGAKPRMRDIYRRRTLSLMCIFCILFLACFARFAQLQLFRDSTAAEAADRRTVVRALEASRGTINDANGVILAQSADRYTVYADQRGAAGFEPLECSQNYETECHQIDGKNVEGTGPAAVAGDNRQESLRPVCQKLLQLFFGRDLPHRPVPYFLPAVRAITAKK